MTQPKIADVQRAVAEHFGVPIERMRGANRFRQFARPQQVAMYLARELTGRSLRQLGGLFDQDHKAIVRSHSLVADLKLRDPAIAKAIDDLTRSLTDDPRQHQLQLVA